LDITLDGGPEKINIQKLELIVNNRIVAESQQIPVEFSVDEIEENPIKDEHWIKARLTYEHDGREVVVETPYYRNTWWPYGGAN